MVGLVSCRVPKRFAKGSITNSTVGAPGTENTSMALRCAECGHRERLFVSNYHYHGRNGGSMGRVGWLTHLVGLQLCEFVRQFGHLSKAAFTFHAECD